MLPAHALTRDDAASSARWIVDGRKMARREPDSQAALASINLKFEAETATATVAIASLKATGNIALKAYNQINERLVTLAFDSARHLRALARGRVDLWFAIALTTLNGVLAAIVMAFGQGPLSMRILLSLLVLAACLPVEEFFHAHKAKAPLREGIFLTLAFLALGATFALGSVRGLLLVGPLAEDAGPATTLLHSASVTLRYTLGILALVSEVLAGWKWFEARTRLYSDVAQAAKRRDELSRELVDVYSRIKSAETEPDTRRKYRIIGAKQALAELGREDGDGHLRRAVLGAGIALLVVALLLLASSLASAASLDEPRIRTVLLDLSKSRKQDDLKADIEAVERIINSTEDGGRVLVVGITNNFGTPRILFDMTVRGSGGFGLALQAGREQVVARWRKASASLAPTYAHTAIIGTLQLLSYVIDRPHELFVLSDGREDVAVNLEDVPEVNVPKAMERLRRQDSIASLHGTRVHLLGVSALGKSAKYLSSLRTLWADYFEASGAVLESFRIDRMIPEAKRVTP